MSIHTSLPYIMYALVPALASTQVIVGLRYPQPRWFLGNGVVPPPANGVVADGIDVVADGIAVVAT